MLIRHSRIQRLFHATGHLFSRKLYARGIAVVTIKQVSIRCGLSISAVSKALNNYPDISAATRERVALIAREMGYIPNATARALKTNRTYNIGVLLDDDQHKGLLHQFFVTVLENFKSAVERRGYDITLMNHNLGERVISYLDHCRYRNLDGVFIACMNFADPEVSEIALSELPLVAVDHLYSGRAAVFSDNAGGLDMLVRHAAALGHRKIAYIHGTPSGVTECRLAGYHAALGSLGLPMPAEYCAPGRYRDTETTFAITGQLLALPNPPTCIIMPDDYAALGGMEALRAAGLRVPEDISVMGYDGTEIFSRLSPRLTTIRQDMEALGRVSAEILLAQIEKGAHSQEKHAVTIPVSLVAGQTAALPSVQE
jgi:LacI family transcriptional regulator